MNNVLDSIHNLKKLQGIDNHYDKPKSKRAILKNHDESFSSHSLNKRVESHGTEKLLNHPINELDDINEIDNILDRLKKKGNSNQISD